MAVVNEIAKDKYCTPKYRLLLLLLLLYKPLIFFSVAIGAIIGAIVGGVLIIVGIVFLVIYCKGRARRKTVWNHYILKILSWNWLKKRDRTNKNWRCVHLPLQYCSYSLCFNINRTIIKITEYKFLCSVIESRCIKWENIKGQSWSLLFEFNKQIQTVLLLLLSVFYISFHLGNEDEL